MEIVGVSQVLKKLSSVASTTPPPTSSSSSSLMKQSQIDENDDRLMDNNITINPSNDFISGQQQCSDNNKKLTDESEICETPKCGYFNWKPDFLQRFMTIQYCLVFLCLAGAVQGTACMQACISHLKFNKFKFSIKIT